jgi:hypothetical protein
MIGGQTGPWAHIYPTNPKWSKATGYRRERDVHYYDWYIGGRFAYGPATGPHISVSWGKHGAVIGWVPRRRLRRSHW